jgi:hypothetical protein
MMTGPEHSTRRVRHGVNSRMRAFLRRLSFRRRTAYRQALGNLARAITAYDAIDELSGADMYEFVCQWMAANRIPILNVTGYLDDGTPVYADGEYEER